MKEILGEYTPFNKQNRNFEENWLAGWSVMEEAAQIAGFVADRQYQAVKPVIQGIVDREVSIRIIAVLQTLV